MRRRWQSEFAALAARDDPAARTRPILPRREGVPDVQAGDPVRVRKRALGGGSGSLSVRFTHRTRRWETGGQLSRVMLRRWSRRQTPPPVGCCGQLRATCREVVRTYDGHTRLTTHPMGRTAQRHEVDGQRILCSLPPTIQTGHRRSDRKRVPDVGKCHLVAVS